MARITLIVAGAVTVLLGLASLAGGGTLVAVHETQRDDTGYYTSGANTMATASHAFVSDDLDVGTDGPDWLFRDGRLGTVRVTAEPAAKPIFVGVARESQVDAYLRGVAHERITDFDLAPFTVESDHRQGTSTPSAPADQGFWAAAASGTGSQTVSWPVEEGTWAVVVMNADGSPGVQTDVSVGAKVGLLLWLGVGLLAAGGLIAIGGVVLLFFGARTPSAATAPTAPRVPPAGAGATP